MEKYKIKWSSSVVIDILLVYFAFILTYFTCKQLNPDLLARFGQLSFLSSITSNTLLLLSIATLVTIVRIATFLCFRIYKPIWQYAGVKEFRTFAAATGISSLILVGISVIFTRFDTWTFFLIDGIYSAIIVGFIKFSHSIIREGRLKGGSTTA